MPSVLLTSQIITQLPGRPDPGRAGREAKVTAAESGQNKSINDAGWGIFLRVLSVKAESAGRRVSAVDPSHTSQRRAECGHAAAGNRVSQLAFRCLIRGHQANANVNAARNILRAGLALQEAQDAV
jgi:putative transposase